MFTATLPAKVPSPTFTVAPAARVNRILATRHRRQPEPMTLTIVARSRDPSAIALRLPSRLTVVALNAGVPAGEVLTVTLFPTVIVVVVKSALPLLLVSTAKVSSPLRISIAVVVPAFDEGMQAVDRRDRQVGVKSWILTTPAALENARLLTSTSRSSSAVPMPVPGADGKVGHLDGVEEEEVSLSSTLPPVSRSTVETLARLM
ncbi:MAG: hypothetical protein R3F53_21685 [Gammaproteobacteria bacterium]